MIKGFLQAQCLAQVIRKTVDMVNLKKQGKRKNKGETNINVENKQ